MDPYEEITAQGHNLGSLFYQKSQECPNSVAIIEGDETTTYSQLHQQASTIAEEVRQLETDNGVPIGIIVQHGSGDVVAQLGVIYAGGCCVPVDPLLLDEQIENRLKKLGVEIVVVDKYNQHRNLPFKVVCIDNDCDARVNDYQPIRTGCLQTTHLIHTSGTTGDPKVIRINGRSIIHSVLHAPLEPVRPHDVVAHANNSSFDVSLFDVWGPLLQGATVAVVDKTTLLDLPLLKKEIDRLGITILATTTAFLNLAAATCPRVFAQLRICFIGGETANPSAVATILKEGPPNMLVNAYGPTECCIWCLAHRITQKDVESGTIPIGRPIGHSIVYIADDTGQSCSEGELWIAGPGVSEGYIDDEDKNSSSFINIYGLSTESAEPIRFYRTGDIVRRSHDGQIHYIGRRDHQVKIRGFRVELQAVEEAIMRTGLFTEVVAMKMEVPQTGAGSVLVAYAVAASSSRTINTHRVMESLNKSLPHYMVPQLEIIPRMPLNSHGKIDRRELAGMYTRRWTRGLPFSPGLDTRSSLAIIWSRVLAQPAVKFSDDDDFFTFGGTSIQAVLLVNHIRDQLKAQMSLLELYENSTLAALTKLIDEYKMGKSSSTRDDRDAWITDTMLADDLCCDPSSVVDWRRDTEGRVFLTGATGFVGAFFLADLLEKPHIHQVGCLVRANDEMSGLERLRSNMTSTLR